MRAFRLGSESGNSLGKALTGIKKLCGSTTLFFLIKSTPVAILNVLDRGGSPDRKRGWGVRKWERLNKYSVVWTAAYAPKPRFRSQLPWLPHILAHEYSLEMAPQFGAADVEI